MKFTVFSSEMDNFSIRWGRKSWKKYGSPLQIENLSDKYDDFFIGEK